MRTNGACPNKPSTEQSGSAGCSIHRLHLAPPPHLTRVGGSHATAGRLSSTEYSQDDDLVPVGQRPRGRGALHRRSANGAARRSLGSCGRQRGGIGRIGRPPPRPAGGSNTRRALGRVLGRVLGHRVGQHVALGAGGHAHAVRKGRGRRRRRAAHHRRRQRGEAGRYGRRDGGAMARRGVATAAAAAAASAAGAAAWSRARRRRRRGGGGSGGGGARRHLAIEVAVEAVVRRLLREALRMLARAHLVGVRVRVRVRLGVSNQGGACEGVQTEAETNGGRVPSAPVFRKRLTPAASSCTLGYAGAAHSPLPSPPSPLTTGPGRSPQPLRPLPDHP